MLRPLDARHCTLGVLSLALALFGAAFTDTAIAQSQEEMSAMMEAMTPGPHHEKLASRAGTWKTTSKFWFQPGQPPQETTGSASIDVLMGGRFVQEVTTANMMGMPWEGRGIFGYDNTTKKHIGTWFDSFGTMIMSFEGTCDGSCNVVSLTGVYFDPISKSEKAMKTVSTMKNENLAVTELFDVGKDGSETKTGEITYTRVKGAKEQAQR